MRIFLKIVSVALLLASTGFSSDLTNEITPVSATGNHGNLAVFAQKVRSGKSVTIGFIGGSITQGSIASKYENCYYWKTRTRINRELKERASKGNFICAAVPGTTSIYGCYRIGPQLLGKDLDLLIVEFAVNDMDAGKAALDGMEGLVRQTLTRKPDTAILFFYTCSKQQVAENYVQGKAMASVIQHHKVAEHYQIPEVHTGPMLAALYEKDKTILDRFFIDSVHPRDPGHDYYSQWLCKTLVDALELKGSTEVRPLPKALSTNNYETAGMCGITPLTQQGEWVYVKPELWRPFGTWKTEFADAEMSFDVTNAVGLALSTKNDFLYKLPGMPDFKKGKINGYPAEVPRFFNFEKTSGTVTLKNLTGKPGIHLTGVITRD